MKKTFASKRIIAIVLVLAVVVACFATLAACNKRGPVANFNVPENGYDGSEVTIKFDHTMGANLREVLDAYIVEFNKLYPNIHIDHEQIGNYDDVRDQVITELSAGTQPDIAYCYPDHVAMFNLSGKVVQLDNLIASDIEITRADGEKEKIGLTKEQIDDFVPAYYNEGRQFGDELMYTMPFLKSTEVLYYNKTFFDANNLKVPTTWDEMEEVCKKIKQIDPKSIPLGYDSEANWFITMCEQLNSGYTTAEAGNYFVFNNATNKQFVERFKGWYQNAYVTTQTIYGAYTSGLFVNQDTTTSRSYMSIGSSAGATHQRPDKVNGEYPFEVGIAPIPQMNPNNPKVISQGPSVCIFNKGDDQKVVASWLFVKFLTTSVDFQAEFSMASGYVPVIKSVTENEAYAKFLNNANGGSHIAALSAKVCSSQVDAYYTSPAFVGSAKARDEVNALMVAALSGEKTIDQAFTDAIAECEYAVD